MNITRVEDTDSGYAYHLPNIANATVLGGADIPFSNNGPLENVTHTAGTTTLTVPTAGNYLVKYGVTITAGVGSAVAIAVNGTVDASTNLTALVATGNMSGTAILNLAAGDVLTLRNNSAVAMTLTLAPSVGAQISLVKLGVLQSGFGYHQATLAYATILGGADVPFSNNGTMNGVTHTPGTTMFTVPSAGRYQIDYGVNITAGIGSGVAIAVNGTVDTSTNLAVLVATGKIKGTAILNLAAGDVISLRNNSAVPMTLGLAPYVGAQLNIIKID
jgi:hypothetical protein